jgi:hypothetical protein
MPRRFRVTDHTEIETFNPEAPFNTPNKSAAMSWPAWIKTISAIVLAFLVVLLFLALLVPVFIGTP